MAGLDYPLLGVDAPVAPRFQIPFRSLAAAALSCVGIRLAAWPVYHRQTQHTPHLSHFSSVNHDSESSGSLSGDGVSKNSIGAGPPGLGQLLPDPVHEGQRIPVSAIIFDFDGTLLDFEGASHVALTEALNGAKDSHGNLITVSWATQSSLVGTRPVEWAPNVLRDYNIPPEWLTPQQYIDGWYASVKRQYFKLKLFPGVMELLGKLHKAG
eukprot:g24686.t1